MNKVNNLPRDFFLYLFATGSLYFIAVTTIALLWQYINYFFPDESLYQGGITTGMRFAIATLVILFPVYIFVMRFLSKDIDRHPDKKDLWVRRWLVYITLFIAAVTMVVDLVSLVFSFLGGELALRFGLKALAVLIVAVAVFVYYLYNLRRKPGTDVGRRKLIMWITIIVVAALVFGAFFIVGSPETNRTRKFDEQRLNDLQAIQWQVLDYYQTRGELPAELGMIEDDFDYFTLPQDPDTGEAYGYEIVGDLNFNLCANFSLALDATTSGTGRDFVTPAYGFKGAGSWEHEAGMQCFERTIDPEQYPVRKQSL